MAGAALGGALSTFCAHAQDIRVSPASCETGVTLVAHRARTSDVLQQLSRSLGFAMRLEAPQDSIVSLEVTRPPAELLNLLLASQNAIVVEGSDPKCPGKRRVTSVWVLRAGGNGLPASQRPGALPWVVSPEAREQDEIYMRAHGMLPELPASAPTASPPLAPTPSPAR